MIGIFDTSSVARCVEILLEYLMLDFFFSGGYVYYLFEMFYILTFESFVRQPRTAARVALDKLKPVPDHENPLVIGRKRRPAHAPLRSFEDKRSALLYWSKTYHSLTRKYIPQCGSKLDQPVQNSRNVNGGKNRIEKNPSNAPSTPPVSPKRTSLFSTLSAAFSRTPPPASQIKETESSDEDDANDHDENSGSEDVDRSSLTPNIYMLSGLAGQPDASAPWRFTLIGSPSDAPMGWEHTKYDEETSIWKTTGDKGDDVSEKSDSPTWVDMSVPSHWQLQGHDIPIYTNTSYPFQFDPPRARRTGKWRVADCDAGIGCSPETQHPRGSSLHELEPGENATGLYRKTFSLPSDWEASNSGERVFLCFEGVDSCMHVYVNGNYVGYSQDSCLPAEYDITDALLDNTDSATHTLAVQVMRWCDGSYLEDQDKWWLSGIYREVYLMKKPSSFISDYEINTDLETVNDTSTATITVSVLVEKFINSLSASNNASNDAGAEAAVIQGDMQGMNGNASIKEQFDDCVERLKHVDTKFDNDTKLRMYALFKQASTPTGPTSARPGIFDPVAGAKWDAWKKVGGLSKEQAMEEYVQLITGLIGVNEALVGVGSESGVGIDTTSAVIQGDMQGMNGNASIKEQFDDCVERLKHVDTKFNNDTKLRMYALFKQASTPTGPTSARPGIFDPVAGAKWDAWKKVGGLSKEQAMEEYVQLITGLIGVNEALVGVGSESGVGAVGNPLAGNLQNASNNNDEVALNHYAIRAEVYEVGSLACSLSDRAAVMEKFSTHANPVATRVGTLEINREFPSKEEADGLECSTMAAVDIGLDEVNLTNKDTRSNAMSTLQLSIDHPHLWNAETPYLYVIIISLYKNEEDASKDRNVIDIESHRFGIRTVGRYGRHGALGINNKVITVAGVNRHEFHMEKGRAVSEADMVQDAMLMKQLNFNAVRLSHYPQHPLWLEICDLCGLYVVDEANIETHGFQILGQAAAYLGHHADWEGALFHRVTRMYERDKNYGCIISWSLGNECGVGPTQKSMADWLRTRDPRRFVQYESGGARSIATDIIAPMYQRPAWCRHQALHDHDQRPVILCEYAHAMGNSGGCFADYWEDIWNPELPRLQGAFIWDFIDQGLLLPGSTSGKNAKYGYGGDFGDLPHTKQFCINGILGPDRKPHPSAYEAKACQSHIAVQLVEANESTLGDNDRASDSDGYDSDQGNQTSLSSLEIQIINRRSFASLKDVTVMIYIRCNLSKAIVVESNSEDEDGGMTTNTNDRNQEPIYAYTYTPSDSILNANETMNLSTESIFKHILHMSHDTSAILDVSPSLNLHYNMLSDVWFEVQIVQSSATQFVPSGHLINRTCLHSEIMKNALVEVLRSSLTNVPVTPIRNKENKILMSRNVSISDETDICYTSLSSAEKKDLKVCRIEWMTGEIATNYCEVCERTGRLLSWKDKNGNSLLSQPIELCVYRAAIDNDRGGGPLSYRSRWSNTGLDKATHMRHDEAIIEGEELSNGSVSLSLKWHLHCNTTVRSTTTLVAFPWGGLEIRVRTPITMALPTLPRVGLRWAMPGRYSQVNWYGEGPLEAYDDRRSNVCIGTYSSSVTDLHTPYVVPGENGRRADPRWITFSDGSSGLCVIPASINATAAPLQKNTQNDIPRSSHDVSGWGFSASQYSLEVLDACSHNHDLDKAQIAANKDQINHTYIHIDSKHMGVGGYDSWSPNVDQLYQIRSGTTTHVDCNVLMVPYDVDGNVTTNDGNGSNDGQKLYAKFHVHEFL